MAKKTAGKPENNFSSARKTAVKAATQVAEVVVQAAEAVKEHVVAPVIEAVAPARKARYVREPKAASTAAATPLPAPSKKSAGMMMSNDLKTTPRNPSVSGTKDAKGPKRKLARS